MKAMKFNMSCLLFAVLCTVGLASCERTDETRLDFDNKCIKRSLGPNVAGNEIEFAYAMAIQPYIGRLVSAQVEASIAGAEGTWLEHRSYHAKLDGMDTAVVVGNPSVTDGRITKVDYTVDTCAATLRYYYKIPEEAKGKQVSFRFSATASTGATVSCDMGAYAIASMDMKLDLKPTVSKCYFSMENMDFYTADEAAAMPDKIDLIYLFRNYNTTDTVKYNHSFVSPATDAKFRPSNLKIPEGMTRSTKLRDVGVKDAHLARLDKKDPPEAQPAIFIDDIDLRDMDMATMPDYALDLIANDGMWIETQGGKYKAYMYVNAANKGRAGLTVSVKRYTMY